MWSLPNIQALNERAVKEHKARKGRSPSIRGKKCEYCNNKATTLEPYYDIFGDKEVPKGHIILCSDHISSGALHEHYFWCDGCNRYHVRNYTWELYSIEVDGEEYCLRCAFEKYIEDPKNWIEVCGRIKGDFYVRGRTGNPIISKDALAIRLSFDNLRRTKHLIAVESTYWKDHLDFVGNVEFDSYSGSQISGGHLEELVRDTLFKHDKCILILDAKYQFAVSIGVYVAKKEVAE